MTAARKIQYDEDYNPIIKYWNWINLNRQNRRRTPKKVHKVYNELVRIINDPKSEWEYDPVKANHAIEFIENYCRHSKGKWWEAFHIRIMAKSPCCCYLWNSS